MFDSIKPGESGWFWFSTRTGKHFIREVFKNHDHFSIWIKGSLGSVPLTSWLAANDDILLGPVEPFTERN